jgi:hypothetical protein
LIGVMQSIKRIIAREAYESGRVRQNAQDSKREFITLIACISTIGNKIPTTLLYTGESYDLRDT